jgi:hypothetical protein
MCFVWLSEQTVTFAVYIINRLSFIKEVESVYCTVRTESLCVTQIRLVFKGLLVCNWVPYQLIFIEISSRACVVMAADWSNSHDTIKGGLNSVNARCHPVQQCVCSVFLPGVETRKPSFLESSVLAYSFLKRNQPVHPSIHSSEFSTSCTRTLHNLEQICMLLHNATVYRKGSKWPPAAWMIEHSVANHFSNAPCPYSFRQQADILVFFVTSFDIKQKLLHLLSIN